MDKIFSVFFIVFGLVSATAWIAKDPNRYVLAVSTFFLYAIWEILIGHFNLW